MCDGTAANMMDTAFDERGVRAQRRWLVPRTGVRYVVTATAVALLYVLSARWGLNFWVVQNNVTLVWPPAGIALAALLLCGYRMLPGVVLGAFLATLSTGAPVPFALATAIGNPLEALVGAYLLQRVVGFQPGLGRVRDVLGLVGLAAGLSTVVSATIGVAGLCLNGMAPWTDASRLGLAWWLGDALGILIVTPVLLTCLGGDWARWSLRRATEALAVFALLALTSYRVFAAPVPVELVHLPLEYIAFPFLIWAAFRYGPPGSALAALLVSGIAVAGLAQGFGPFKRDVLQDGLLLLTFMAVFALTALLLSAVLSERNRAVVALRAAHGELDARIQQRTAELREINEGLVSEVTRRQRAETDLRQTTNTLNSILTSASEYAIAAIDPEYRVIHFNPAAERLFGYSAAEAAGQTVPDIHQQCNVPREKLQRVVRTAIEDGKWEASFEMRRGDEGTRTVHAVVMPMHDEDDACTGFVLFAQDVTARKRAAELARAQRSLALKLAAVTDLTEALELCTNAALRVTGMDGGGVYLVDETNGALHLAFHTGLPAAFVEEVKHIEPSSPPGRMMLAGEPAYGRPEEFSPALDVARPYDELCAVALVPIRHEGRVIASLNVASSRMADVPEPVRHALETIAAQIGSVVARLKAEQSHARLATAVAQAAEGVVITDADGRIEYVNPAFERMTGYTRDEVLGQTPRVLRSGQHDEAFYRELWETITRGDTWTGRLVNRRKDGRVYDEDATISPVRDGAGRIVNYVGLKRDVTREVALEAHLRQAQKLEAVGQLAGGVAHEFNNLLTAILGYSEIIAASVSPDHPACKHAERIKKSTDRAAGLVRQLLTFGRKQIVQPQPLSLNAVVQDAVRLLRPLLGERVRVEVRIDPEAGLVRADPGQMQQLLTNLCLNARDAMPRGGTLTIETAAVYLDDNSPAEPASLSPGRYATLAVRDTGCGMDAETRTRLFEPFFTTKGTGQGTGLGLATVYGIVQQHNGRIVVHSVPDQGTTFRVYLPRLARRDQASATLPEEPGPRHRPSRATILLVEDEDEVRDVVQDILMAEGYAVLAARHADDALRLSQAHDGPLDLLVTDMVMPGLSGPELAARLQPARADMKVLYISGYAASSLSEHGQLGPDMAFLAKPFTRSQLAERVREVLGVPPSRGRDQGALPVAEDAR